MKIKLNSGNFEACPEYTGKGICVDVTPLRKRQSQYGEQEVFKVVFEVDLNREDGGRYCVWSRNFTPSLNEKANLRKFLRSWFGRDLTETELQDFDTECLIGKPAQLVVVNEHKDGEVYANIVACTPDKSGSPLKASGKHVRTKDRQGGPAANGTAAQGDGEKESKGGGGYRRAEQPESSAPGEVDHAAVKIHVGKCKGLELRDLSPEQVKALIEHWVPVANGSAKLSADDRRLLAALQWWEMENDQCPF
jgi:hypothetical protein